LLPPYDTGEMRRVIEAAAARSYMRSLPPARAVSGTLNAALNADVA
jgi:hypothetical protein